MFIWSKFKAEGYIINRGSLQNHAFLSIPILYISEHFWKSKLASWGSRLFIFVCKPFYVDFLLNLFSNYELLTPPCMDQQVARPMNFWHTLYGPKGGPDYELLTLLVWTKRWPELWTFDPACTDQKVAAHVSFRIQVSNSAPPTPPALRCTCWEIVTSTGLFQPLLRIVFSDYFQIAFR